MYLYYKPFLGPRVSVLLSTKLCLRDLISNLANMYMLSTIELWQLSVHALFRDLNS
uniref:Uncharacterized protein n=1 Tax=Setaria italica TaxID=4555 RepID=K4A3M6_SETIT